MSSTWRPARKYRVAAWIAGTIAAAYIAATAWLIVDGCEWLEAASCEMGGDE